MFLALTSFDRSSKIFSHTSFNTIKSNSRVGGGETWLVWGAGIKTWSRIGWFVDEEGVSSVDWDEMFGFLSVMNLGISSSEESSEPHMVQPGWWDVPESIDAWLVEAEAGVDWIERPRMKYLLAKLSSAVPNEFKGWVALISWTTWA